MAKASVDLQVKIILMIVSSVIFMVLLIYWLKMPRGFADDPGPWGEFGDYVGGLINPVVSLATLIAVLLTLRQNQALVEATAQQVRLASEALTAEKDARANHAAEAQSQIYLEATNRGVVAAIDLLNVAANKREQWSAAAILLRDATQLSDDITIEAHKRLWGTFVNIQRARVRPLLGMIPRQHRTSAYFFGGNLHDDDLPEDLQKALTRYREEKKLGLPPRHIEPNDILDFCKFCFEQLYTANANADLSLREFLEEKIKANIPCIHEYLNHLE